MIRARDIIESLIQLNERNVLNISDIDDYVKEISHRSEHPEVFHWLSSTFRKYLINDYENASPIYPGGVTRKFPDWVTKAQLRGEEVFQVYFLPDDKRDFEHVVDFLNYSVENSQTLPQEFRIRDMTRISVSDAIDKSKEWTRWLHKQSHQTDSTEGTEVITKMEGFTWVKVLTSGALDYEGEIMGHCVGSYADAVEKKRCEIYSLRDSSGEPHVTIEVRGREIEQIKGKQDKPVIEKYRPYCLKFVSSGLFNISEKTKDLDNIGAAFWKGKIYALEEAPKEWYLAQWVNYWTETRPRGEYLEDLFVEENKHKLDMIVNKIDVNTKFNYRSKSATALVCAILDPDSDIVLKLLQLGADPNVRYGDMTVLMMAKPDTCEILLENGADPNVLVGEDTAISIAIWNDELYKVELLLDHRADPFKGEENPISLCQSEEMFDLLLSRKAITQKDVSDYNATVDSKDSDDSLDDDEYHSDKYKDVDDDFFDRFR